MATVDIEDLKPNSRAYKKSLSEKPEVKQKLVPIVSSNGVVSTKKSLGRKFAETFIEEDVKDVKEYVIFDVIIPGIKNTILDCMEMIFFAGSRGSSRSRGRSDEHYSYSARYKYKESSRREKRDEDDDNRNVDYRDIVLRDKDTAQDVVDQMRGRIHEYGSASIADLFDLIDITGKYTDNNWGWTKESDIDYRRVSRGYLIDVKEAKLLD